MARKPAYSIETLMPLGAEKLARIILGEVEKNVAFKKIVAAALAGVKGPEAVAKLIDRRLSALERAKGFIDWEKAPSFGKELVATVNTINGELGAASADMAIDRLLRFLATHRQVFDRSDDSSGWIQRAYEDAAGAFEALTSRLDPKNLDALPEKIMAALGDSEHGYLGTVAEAVIPRLPKPTLKRWDENLISDQKKFEDTPNNPKNRMYNWERQLRFSQILDLRQIIAAAHQDLDGLIALELKKPPHMQDTLAVATTLLAAGRAKEALEWVRKEKSANVRVLTEIDLADGIAPYYPTDLKRIQLEAAILEALGDSKAAQELRWTTFERLLDAGILREYIAKLGDFEEFEALERAFEHALKSNLAYLALEFLLEWPKPDLAAKLVTERHATWDGRHYGILAPAAKALEADHPLAASILYRALLNDILERAKAKAYGHGGDYLARLDELSKDVNTEAFRSAGIDDHATYRLQVKKAHGRKAGFWAVAPV